MPSSEWSEALQEGLAQCGPLLAAHARALWWPDLAPLTVQRKLWALVQGGVIHAHREYTTGDRTPRLLRTWYSATPDHPPWPARVATLDMLIDLLAILVQAPGLVSVRSWALGNAGRGRVVVARRTRAGSRAPPAPWCWHTARDPCPPDQAERCWLLIADEPPQPLTTHTTAAQHYATRCAPAHWTDPAPPPIPLLLTATPDRVAPLGQTWAAAWTPRPVLVGGRTPLATAGWVAGRWTEYTAGGSRSRILLEAWLPDVLIPANDARWDAQEYHHRHCDGGAFMHVKG